MVRTLLRLIVAGLLVLPAAAGSRSLGNSIAISLQTPTNLVICTGFCPHLHLTVWEDGRVIVNGDERPRISNEQNARFRRILQPFRPTGKLASVDPSDVLPSACLVKVEWIVSHGNGRSIACSDYYIPTIGKIDAHPASLFSAVMQALRAIHLDPYGRPAP